MVKVRSQNSHGVTVEQQNCSEPVVEENDDCNCSPVTEEVTYSELFDLYTNGQLVPGASYVFDFETIHTIPNSGGTVNTGPTERLTVTAQSNDALEVIAYSESHPEDIIWYDITGAAIAEVATAAGHKGAIHKRISTTKNIDVPCDFRNVKVRRRSCDLTFLGGNAINHVMWDSVITGIGVADNPTAASRGTITLNSQSELPYDATPRINGTGGILSLLLVSGGSTAVIGGALSGLYSVPPSVSASIGTGATFTAVLNGTGGIKSITPITPGSGYSEDTLLVVSGPGTGAVIKAILDNNGGIIGGDILNCGIGYFGTVTVSTFGTTGSGFTGSVTLGYRVASITVNTPGINYTANTVITITGDGFGATASILENPVGYKDVHMFGDGLADVFDVFICPKYVNGVLSLNNITFDATFPNVNCSDVHISANATNFSLVNCTTSYVSITTNNVIYMASYSNQLGFDQHIENFQNSIFLNVFTRGKIHSLTRSIGYKAASNAVGGTYRSMFIRGSNTLDLVFRPGTYCNNNDGPGMIVSCCRVTFEGDCRFLNIDISVFNSLGNIYIKNHRGTINRDISNYGVGFSTGTRINYHINDSETSIVLERIHEGKQSTARAGSGGYISDIQLRSSGTGPAAITTIGEIHANVCDYVGEKVFWGEDGKTFPFTHNDADIGILLPSGATQSLTANWHFIALKFDQVKRRWIYSRSNV